MRLYASASVFSLSSNDFGSTPARRAAPRAAVSQAIWICLISGSMSKIRRCCSRLSGSTPRSLACASPFFNTFARLVSARTNTGMEAWYMEIVMVSPLNDRKKSSTRRATAQHACGKHEKCAQECEHAVDRETEQPERQRDQPHDRPQDQCQQRERPAEDQKQQPQQEGHHRGVLRSSACRVTWGRGERKPSSCRFDGGRIRGHAAGSAHGQDQRHHHQRRGQHGGDRKSTRLNSSHPSISYAVFCLKKKNAGELLQHLDDSRP